MLKLWLIRHGMTEGNSHQRYIGVTDEPLCEEGQKLLEKFAYPKVQALFVSPLKRCRETAEMLFPGEEQRVVELLAECDFGEFENKNYKELADNPHYQEWVDSNGTLPFPGGESKEECADRNLRGFEEVLKVCREKGITEAALVVHGGTIMNIMEAYALPKKAFYEWHVGNGCGYQVELESGEWENEAEKQFLSIQKLEMPSE